MKKTEIPPRPKGYPSEKFTVPPGVKRDREEQLTDRRVSAAQEAAANELHRRAKLTAATQRIPFQQAVNIERLKDPELCQRVNPDPHRVKSEKYYEATYGIRREDRQSFRQYEGGSTTSQPLRDMDQILNRQ